jgi:hypothetical protein
MADLIREYREKQSYYLAEYERGNISEMERDTMLQLFYEKIQELEAV